MKARNIAKGNWIKVDGKSVQVTKTERTGWWTLTGFTEGVGISYKGGSRSGMLRRGPDTQVTHLAGRRPRR